MATNNSAGRLVSPVGRSADKTADFPRAALLSRSKGHPSNSLESKSRWWSAWGIATGFTLVELLVVVAVIAVLIALAFPALRSTIETSRRATCAGNLKTLATAVLSYAGENNGCLPYAYANPNPIKPGPTPWFWAVGDYFGGQYTRPQEVDWINKRSLRALPSCLYCPSAKRETNNSTPYDISYGLNTGLTGQVPGNPPRRVSSIWRPGRMILLADAMSYSEDGGHAWGVWPSGISRRHGTVANVAWLDGHVSRESINELTTNTSYWNPALN